MMNVMGHCSCGAHSCAAEKKVDAKVSVFHEYGKVIFSLLLLTSGIIMNALDLAFFREGSVALIWYIVAYLPVGIPVMKEAWESIREKDYFSEFTLMIIATLGAFYIGEYPEGVAVMLFYTVGELFQDKAVDKAKRNMIGEMVAGNQLFFSVACTMNDSACVSAMKWFRECIFFSRDYTDIPKQLLEYAENKSMLKAITDYAKTADLGIDDMQFEFDNKEIKDDNSFPEYIPEGIKEALRKFMNVLSETSNNSEVRLRMGEVTAKAIHQGENKDGSKMLYSLDLSEESDGTRKLMSLAPAIESALQNGGILLVDELERELHPMLVNFIVSKFQSKNTNRKGAQIVFTTNNTELMNMELLRKDQLYFVDKRDNDGVSELYSISEFATRTTDNIRKGYLVGKYGATPDVEIEEVE